MNDATIQMIERWESQRESQLVFDISTEMNQLTLLIAGRALLNDGFDHSSDDIARWTHEINRFSAKPPLPIVRSHWFPSRTNRKLKATLTEFHHFLKQMIERRRQGTAPPDLLSTLLETKAESNGKSMSDYEIAEEVLGMIIGGHETSSTALTWVWYELSLNPEIERRLCQEIDSIVGEGSLTVDQLPKLVYTKQVVEETLRLHPPFWFENRNAVSDFELGGNKLPKNSLIIFSRYSLHRHRDFWALPEQFKPERFAPGQEENSPSVYASIPFGGGPRVCIGKHFAMMELVTILALVARRFRVVIDTTNRHMMSAQLTMTPKFGLRVRVQPRL